jgi:hypothetical protein
LDAPTGEVNRPRAQPRAAQRIVRTHHDRRPRTGHLGQQVVEELAALVV